MLHDNRVFSVVPAESAEALANQLTQFTWCGCNGFQLGNLLFLNDSFSGDGAQEFGVVFEGKQIESVTFGWCSESQALEIIRDLQRQVKEQSFTVYAQVSNKIETPAEHGRCHLCA